MKAHMEVKQSYRRLTLANVCCTPRLLYPRESKPWYQLGRKLGKAHGRAGLLEKIKISCLCRDSSPKSRILWCCDSAVCMLFSIQMKQLRALTLRCPSYFIVGTGNTMKCSVASQPQCTQLVFLMPASLFLQPIAISGKINN